MQKVRLFRAGLVACYLVLAPHSTLQGRVW